MATVATETRRFASTTSKAWSGSASRFTDEVVGLYREGLTTAEIADLLGSSHSTIRRRLLAAGEPMRAAAPRSTVSDSAREKFLALYSSGRRLTTAAREAGIGHWTGRRIALAAGLSIRTDPRPTCEEAPNWNGGRYVTDNGYVMVHLPSTHPYSDMRVNRCYVMEHRLVMAEHIGRSLRANETVHHRNGVKDDNRIENLELRIGSHGPGAALECAHCGSRDLRPVEGASE